MIIDYVAGAHIRNPLLPPPDAILPFCGLPDATAGLDAAGNAGFTTLHINSKKHVSPPLFLAIICVSRQK